MKSRLLLIGMFALLMLGAVYIVGTALYEESNISRQTSLSENLIPSIPVERNVFSRTEEAMTYKEMPESKKDLASYYKNRAYPGAPPSIPHPLISEKGIGGKTCLQCHQNGGFVQQFRTYAPITPHPELLNCMQCHVPQKTTVNFKSTDWEKIDPAQIRQSAMPGAPPIIPHELDMRSNCLACHGGASAPKEIRVSHPERINCRQCHVTKNTQELFVKPEPDASVFQRPNQTLGLHKQQLKKEEVTKIAEWAKNKNN